MLSLSEIGKRMHNARIKRTILAENRNIAFFEKQNKEALKGISDSRRRLINLHNSIIE